MAKSIERDAKANVQSLSALNDVPNATKNTEQLQMNPNITKKRNYHLNKPKALNKKLESTANRNIEIIETGGGVKIIMNTGTYEVFKHVTSKFYSRMNENEDLQAFKCKVNSISDKNRMNVETQYRIMHKRRHDYTLNMYHTNCTCLINGKNQNKFMESDLPQILDDMQDDLVANGVTCEMINEQLKASSLSCHTSTNNDHENRDKSDDDGSTKNCQVSNDDMLCCLTDSKLKHTNCFYAKTAKNTNSVQDTHNCSSVNVPPPSGEELYGDTLPNSPGNSHGFQNQNAKTLTDDSNADENIEDSFSLKYHETSVIEDVLSTITALTSSLNNHIEQTELKFQQLRDEISSIKSQNRVHNEILFDKLDSLQDSTNQAANNQDKFVKWIEKRLQSLSDCIKSQMMGKSNSKQTAQPTPEHTVPKQIVNINNNRSRLSSSGVSAKPFNKSTSPFRRNMMADNRTPTCRPRKPRNKKLMIGSSIFRGISTRGLTAGVDVRTNRGSCVTDIHRKLDRLDLSDYRTMVLYIGGNDAGNKLPLTEFSQKYEMLLNDITQSGIPEVVLCGLCPRSDADVTDYNDIIRGLAEDKSCEFVDCFSNFVLGTRKPANFYYHYDGIHLSREGTAKLLKCIDEVTPVLKLHSSHNSRDVNSRGHHQGFRNTPPQRSKKNWQVNLGSRQRHTFDIISPTQYGKYYY